MKIKLASLDLQFKQGADSIGFTEFNYFYGKMGAGKSSIARLIDFCLGGDLDLSPALQSEFISAKLNLFVDKIPLALERVRDSSQIIAEWTKNEEKFYLIIPARQASGEVLPQTGVENLSDLLFHLAGIRPPKVRRSKHKEDSELERLSLRNLLWFCYIDQDSMDSSFFNLDTSAAFYNRNKSKDVLRFIVGFHQEQVAELESQLQEVREKRMGLLTGAESLRNALESGGIASKQDIELRLEELQQELVQISSDIANMRDHSRKNIPHQVDTLRQKARQSVSELLTIEDAVASIESTIDSDRRHLNELQMLKVKFKRSASAKSILAGVEFTSCPRCSQTLPIREFNRCAVCGQLEPEQSSNNLDVMVIDADASSRINELEDSITRHSSQLKNLRRKQQELSEEKAEIDRILTNTLSEYDSAYLSTTLGTERKKAEVEQTISKLKEYSRLSGKVDEMITDASNLEGRESELRLTLKDIRAAAEKDTANLQKLEELFLDCLLRAQLPGIKKGDDVAIKPPHFLPEVLSAEVGDLAVTSFANISSGGKKSLFKSCFAIAVHRLAVSINAVLPTFMLIDSPMKNISERENREQFEGFHKMLYELAEAELLGTQFILIDKEFFAPDDGININFSVRHMTPEDDNNPPLIRYYRGH